MKNQNKILDFEEVLNTYSTNIPYKQLELLKHRGWLPIKKGSECAKEFAYLVGKVMGDGHLNKSFELSFFGQKGEIKKLGNLIQNSFNLEESRFSIEFKKAWGICFVLRVNDSLLGRVLFCLGAPKGNKTKQRFLVPDWIHNSKGNSRMFLKGLFEDELTTIKIEKNNYSVNPRFKLAKEEKLLYNLRSFLKQLINMVEQFDIKCSNISLKPTSKKGQRTKELYFHINRNKNNIINFAKNIGFRVNTDKINQLERCIDILNKTKFNRKPFIDKSRIIKLSEKGHSIRQIGRIVNLNRTSVHRVISKNRVRGRGNSQRD